MQKMATLALKLGAAVVVVGSVVAIPLAGVAVASSGCGTLPSDNAVYINCVAPPTSQPYATYTDGQQINLAMGPNTIFSPSDTNAGSIVAIECSYNGGDPMSAASCDARSGAGDFPFPVRANGSWDYEAQNNGDEATVFGFPDATFTSSAIQCDATHACVWYVGENYNDFTQPKVFSAPFFVTASQSQAPEAPFPILLPIVGVGLVGGGLFLVNRRRHRKSQRAARA